MRLLPTLSSPTGVSLNCVAQERSRKMTPVPLKTFQSSQNKSQFSTIVLELQITPISLLPISLASSLHGSDRLVVVESSPLIVKTAIHIDVKGNLPPPEQSKENRLPLPHPPQEAKTRQKPMHSEGERERIEVMRAWSRITAIVPSSSSSTSSSVGIVFVEESNVFPALVFFGAASRKLHVSPKHPTRVSLGGALGQDPQDPRRWNQTDSAGEAGGPPKHKPKQHAYRLHRATRYFERHGTRLTFVSLVMSRV